MLVDQTHRQALWHLDQQSTWDTGLVRLCPEYLEHREYLAAELVAKVRCQLTVREYPDLPGKAMHVDQMLRSSSTWTSR